MADLRLFANTSNLVAFVLKHATTGQGLTGLTSASSGLIISTRCDNEATATAYTQAGSTIEGITTLGTFATPTASKCRFKEVDATNHKGLYEFQFADARFAVASSRRLVISVTGAANLLDTDYEMQLVQFNPYDAVRLGLTALPNVAAAGNGGLPTVDASNAVKVQSGTGANQVSLSSGLVALQNGAITAAVIATDAIDNDAIAANAVTEIQSGLATAASISALNNISAADVWAAGTRTLTSFGTLVADIWAAATRTLTAGTNIVLAKGVGVTGFNDLDAAGVRGAVGLASANLDTQLDALPTAAENSDAVWDEVLAGHLTAGSTGAALNAAGSAGDPWTTALPGAYGVGSAGKIVGDNINATISSRSSHSAADVWAVVARTITGGTVTTVSDKTGYALTSGERTSIANALLDLTDGIEVGLTPRGALRLIAAACAGVASGLATATAVYRNAVANSKPRITASVDVDGNRSSVTTDVT